MKYSILILLLLLSQIATAQTWQPVGGGTNNSSHGIVTWNSTLIDLGSFNSPCNRVASWNGTGWTCLAGGVGLVARAAVVWEGKLVVVGDFWNVFQPCVGCNGVAVWDGVSWTPLGDGVNNDVLSATVWNNQVVIAGDFTQADGVPIARIAKWNGTIWESVGPIGAFDNDIRAMVEYDGDLWVGGDFNNVGGNAAYDGLVKYDEDSADWVGGNSGVDLIGGVDESVRVLYVNPNDGNLYMGGEFPELWDGDAPAEDYNMSGIAMYDGHNWFPLGTGLNEYCRAIHEYNGNIIAGGYFTTAGGVSANKIAKWNGTTWAAMGLGFDAAGIDEYVKSAGVWNGIFFAGGAYTQAEGSPMNHISQWYEPVTAPPVAWMTPSATNICASGCIYFMDNSTNSPTSWNWSFPGSSTPSSALQHPGFVCYPTPGTYTATLEACNSFGCTTQDLTIEVSAGASITVMDVSICDTGSATLVAVPGTPGGTFLWSTGDTGPSLTVTPGSTTTYSVTYSIPGCPSGSDSGTVTLSSTPDVILTAGTTSICSGDSVALSAAPSAPGGTWLWSPGGETTSSVTVYLTSPSVFSVEYTLDGCTSAPDSVTISVTPAPTVTVADASICSGDSVTLSAAPSDPGGTYVWSPGGDTTSSITVSPSVPTIYTVVYTLAGCESAPGTATVTINPDPILTVTLSGSVLTSGQAGALYHWLNCDSSFAPIAGATSQSFTPSMNGNYAVQVNLGGCVDTSACTPVILTALMGMQQATIMVYPNPVRDLLHIRVPAGINAPFELTDLMGKIIQSGALIPGEHTLDLSGTASGLYLLKTGQANQTVFKIQRQ